MFLTPSKCVDVLKLEIPLNEMSKFCFAICGKAHVRDVVSQCNDIAKFTEVVTVKKLPKELVLRTDCEEIIPEILRSDDTMKAIEKLKHLLRVIHITDKSDVDSRHPCMLRCEFQLPALKPGASSKEDPARELAKQMMQLAIYLVDVTARSCDWVARHSQVTIKVEKRREERSKSKKKHELQLENAQRRKDVKAAQEKAKIENMGDEERRKYEEKKYRQDLRKRQSLAGKTKVIKC